MGLNRAVCGSLLASPVLYFTIVKHFTLEDKKCVGWNTYGFSPLTKWLELRGTFIRLTRHIFFHVLACSKGEVQDIYFN